MKMANQDLEPAEARQSYFPSCGHALRVARCDTPTSPFESFARFQKVSDLVGVAVGLDHPTTLQQLNELDVLTDAKVMAILRLSE